MSNLNKTINFGLFTSYFIYKFTGIHLIIWISNQSEFDWLG